ncbi:DUF3846 domain-containing protein [Shouchella lonarensis]|uniref:DUF3846 domain-containing protein n=1 Tax=Shouchella lonarensis TaxID=1464122 RepID=A0A1G6HPQ2_9BACI|nr:hypothetical protein [Shouchella lonarensis]SDB95476.1 hypothetical protein SAMN05421737_10480 [Shouchella lonarensis]
MVRAFLLLTPDTHKVEVSAVTYNNFDLKTRQKLVGDHLDFMSITQEIDLWYNKELNTEPTICVSHGKHDSRIIHGPAFFAACDHEEKMLGLTAGQIMDLFLIINEDSAQLTEPFPPFKKRSIPMLSTPLLHVK